ncbi:MAG: molybdenum cofactor guanylyltransferase [Desulfonauticus sp.]|jgi:molybdopterin-guanine dinucleotide biosynthesis protein A|nr:MAG: Molybdenum cofactor guanylyltransferase [Desulfonauticus sp. 38_4375]MDK2921849.1 molybdenum cofactor guanylyltransferase [Desulfonauticus sp.]
MPREVVGAILAGGKSSRLGRDKTWVEYEGEPLLVRTYNLLQQLGLPVYILGRNPVEYGLEDRWLADEIKDIGPMGGIYTGLKNLQKSLLVVSCDLPFLHLSCLQVLLQRRKKIDPDKVMTTFYYPDTGYIEALISIYEYEALEYIQRAIKEKIFKLSLAIPQRVREHIEVKEEWRDYFFNLNYPEDLKKLQKNEK